MTDKTLMERVAELERRVSELDQRTGGMVKMGPVRTIDGAVPLPSDFPMLDARGPVDGVGKITRHLTSDPNDPGLVRGIDTSPRPQNDVYLVLPEEERAKGFVRPYRDAYRHLTCGAMTTMGRALSETYARDPKFYGATYCCKCQMHKPVGEFVWMADGEVVGS